MKLIKKNLPVFLILLFGYALVGLLAWELLERLLSHLNIYLFWHTKTVNLNVNVLALALALNPGFLFGSSAGVYIFRRL